MKHLSFYDWVQRHRLYNNPDCNECSYYPNEKPDSPCKLDGHPCYRLKLLLANYRKIKLAEMKRDIKEKDNQPHYTSSEDFDGTDRGHKVGGLTQSHLNEGA
jgi:hypothetical protein